VGIAGEQLGSARNSSQRNSRALKGNERQQVSAAWQDPPGGCLRRRLKRSHTENIWLRTKRYNASGKVVSGTGGVCYLYFPARLSPAQKRALAAVGIR
jgi:hypothetical protein